MISSASIAVFSGQKIVPAKVRNCFFPTLLAIIFFPLFPGNSFGASLEVAAAALAQKVCAPPMQKSLRVEWTGAPQIAGESFAAFKNTFLARLESCGVVVSENPADPTLHVTVQLTVSRVLIIAELTGLSESAKVRMVAIPRSTLSVPTSSSSSLRLRKELLWQQENPLDGAVEWSDESSHEGSLFLLGEGLLIRGRFENQAWKLVDSTELPATPRQHRLGKGDFIYDDQTPGKLAFLLDGKICSIQSGSSISFNCRQTYIGGKVVTIVPACDGKVQILATGMGDYTQPDRISLFGPEVSRPPPLSEEEFRSGSIEMPGPVLDYMTNEDGKSVSAVVRNLSTGIYEVYRITTVCGQ